MSNNNILKLVKECHVNYYPESDSLTSLRDEVNYKIKETKVLLSKLQQLSSEVEFQITLSHMDNDEES